MDKIELNLPAFPELSETAKTQIGRLDMIHIIAPTQVGKTLHIEECAKDPRFGSITSFMTRPPKPGESAGAAYFLPNTEETVESLRRQAKEGKILNITQHPATGYIYGSYVTDYTYPYNLMPTLTTVISGFRAVPFRVHKTIAITTDPNVWSERLITKAAQGPNSARDILKRLVEAESCYHWAEQDGQTTWVSLAYNHISENAGHLKQLIVDDNNHDDTHARQEANFMLATIPDMRRQIEQLL